MGACGCGDFPGGNRFPGPKGTVYVLAFYPACDDCDTPAGFVVHRFKGSDIEDFDVMSCPSAKFHDDVFSQPSADPRLIAAALVESFGDAMALKDDPSMTLREHIECDPGDWRDAINEGVWKSVHGENGGGR